MDFPHGKGVIKEALLVAPSGAAEKAMGTLKPVVIDERAPEAHDTATAEGVKASCNIPLQIVARPSGSYSFAARFALSRSLGTARR